MDIKEKLRQIESLNRKQEVSPATEPVSGPREKIEHVLDGVVKESPAGAFFYYEKDFPLSFKQGCVELGALLTTPSAVLPLVGKNPDLASVDLQKSLFIDTETSGLSGGAGTFAFLVGIGYFKNEFFRIVQFFMNDFTEEHPLLHELNSVVDNHEFVVSYNGKCFDVPLLESRHVYHRINSPLTRLAHLDLLHAVRRLWKHELPDCSLGTAEEAVLAVRRQGDIPGYLIPHIYFEYMRTGNPNPLKPIFYHNQQDILSMVGLLVRMLRIFENPLQECVKSGQVLAIAKVYEALKRFKDANDLYEGYLTKNSSDRKKEILFRIALNYKKLADWSKAAQVWRECLASHPYHPLPYIELAKYLEHRKNEPDRAIKLVEEALKQLGVLEELHRLGEWRHYKEDLEYRKDRLKKKAV
ncbi:MAG: ribonuclease H-like domain-containing protein [bacterium]